MPARVVLVHDEPEFLEPLDAALRQAGHDVATFADPMEALDALDAAQSIEVLVTRVQFPVGKPNGLAVARMARVKRPEIRVIFTAQPEFARYAEGVGVFMPRPVSVADVVATVERLLLKSGDPDFG
jgi:DNA-binding NtrC family response regulator